MFVVDTNILVYAANSHAPENAKCRGLLDAWWPQVGAWFLTWGICYEFLRVSTHPRVFPSPLSSLESWSFLETLLASPGIQVLVPTDRHADVLAQVLREVPLLSGNSMHDAETAVLMREHGIRRIYTRDTDFHRFPFVEPLDPLTQPA
jgi:toxin-antitoxin system PIN domain toxin